MTKKGNLSAYSSWRIVIREGFWTPAVTDYLGTSNFSLIAALALTTTPTSDETFSFYRAFNDAVPTLLAKANLTGKVDVSMIGLPSFLE